jgi:hypothetical protein
MNLHIYDPIHVTNSCYVRILQLLGMYNFGFQGSAASNVERFSTFWQTLQLPSTGYVCFRKPYIEQAVGGEWDVKDVVGRTEEWAAIQLELAHG